MEWLGILISFLIISICSGRIGYLYARETKRIASIGEIERYIKEYIPDKWAAYKKGINEGYEQGLRDGQDNPS